MLPIHGQPGIRPQLGHQFKVTSIERLLCRVSGEPDGADHHLRVAALGARHGGRARWGAASHPASLPPLPPLLMHEAGTNLLAAAPHELPHPIPLHHVQRRIFGFGAALRWLPSTLRYPGRSQVCDVVLKDDSVSKEVIQRRAEALRDLAAIFQVPAAIPARAATAEQEPLLARQSSQLLQLRRDPALRSSCADASDVDLQSIKPSVPWQGAKRKDWSGLNLPGVSSSTTATRSGGTSQVNICPPMHRAFPCGPCVAENQWNPKPCAGGQQHTGHWAAGGRASWCGRAAGRAAG